MLRSSPLRFILHGGQKSRDRRFSPLRRVVSCRPLRRGSLLAELDRAPDAGRTRAAGARDGLLSTTGTSLVPRPSLQDSLDGGGGQRSDLSVKSLVADDAPPQNASSVARGARCADCGPQLPSLDLLEAQQAALRTMFNDPKRRCIRMRKDLTCLREERRVFRLSHGRAPSSKEVSPFVDVDLSPVAALKLTKHLSPHSSIRDVVVRGILLQRNITRSKLVQSGEKTLFRCLSCFHVYAACPRTLLRDEVAYSWMQYEAERATVDRARELARRPQLRKQKYSVGRQQSAFAENPKCCPSCGSARAEWLMEYVHHRTHA